MAPTKTALLARDPSTDQPAKKKRRRGKKSTQAQQNHTRKWIQKGVKANTVIETIHRPPDDVVGTKKSGARTRKITEQTFPSYRNLPMYAVPDSAALQFNATSDIVQSLQAEGEKRGIIGLQHADAFIVKRYRKLLSDEQQNDIIALWDKLKELSPTHFLASKDGNRSAIAAYHFGVWQRTAEQPLITRESREQTSETIAAIDALAERIKLVSLQLARIMREDMPDMYERGVACHKYVHSRAHLSKQLQDRPAMDLGPAAFAFAIKEGSSEIPHVDFTDDYSFPNFVVPLGPFIGAEFNCPQLGYRIPIHGGQVLASKARLVIHFSSPHSGRRIAITLFTDSILLKRAQEQGFV